MLAISVGLVCLLHPVSAKRMRTAAEPNHRGGAVTTARLTASPPKANYKGPALIFRATALMFDVVFDNLRGHSAQ